MLHVRTHAEIDLPEASPNVVASWAWSAFMEAVAAVGIVTRSRNRILVPVADRVTPDTACERLTAWLAEPPPETPERWSARAQNPYSKPASVDLEIWTRAGRIISIGLSAGGTDQAESVAQLLRRLLVDGAHELGAAYAVWDASDRHMSGYATGWEQLSGLDGGAEKAAERWRGIFDLNLLTEGHMAVLGGRDRATRLLTDAGATVRDDRRFLVVDVPARSWENVERALVPFTPAPEPQAELLPYVDFGAGYLARWARRQRRAPTPFLLARSRPYGAGRWVDAVNAALAACGADACTTISGTSMAGPTSAGLMVEDAVREFTGLHDFWRADAADGCWVLLTTNAWGADTLAVVAPTATPEQLAPILDLFGSTVEGCAAVGRERDPVRIGGTSGFEAELGLAGPPMWPPGPYQLLAVPHAFPTLTGYTQTRTTEFATILDGTALSPAERLASYRDAISSLQQS